MSTPVKLFVSCPKGMESILDAELTGLGAKTETPRTGGVHCAGDEQLAYRICLWSRLASRVLLPLGSRPLESAEDLYELGLSVDWSDVFAVSSSFSISVAGRSPAIQHTHFAGLKVKDAVADHFRSSTGKRPDVDTDDPDIRIHLHLDRDRATVSLDLSGQSLHRRGYRSGTGEAPLKENLASAILISAGWPEIAAKGGALVDLMCGSGTLLIEGIWMAADIAPGLSRQDFGFEHWLDHVPKRWHDLKQEAQSRRDHGLKNIPPVMGNDIDGRTLVYAKRNARNAGVESHIDWKEGDFTAANAGGLPPGLVITNPPYGERLGEESDVVKLYSLLGISLKQNFPGWRASILTSRPDLGQRLGLRADAIQAFQNGDLPCKLLNFAIAGAPETGSPTRTAPESAFANRLEKNLKHLTKWAKRAGVNCYRLYDADLPEYAIAVDLYQPDASDAEALISPHLHVQEYTAPDSIDPVKAEKRLREALSALQHRFELPAANIHLKQRKKQSGSSQYNRQSARLEVIEVEEHGCRFLVNLVDYLDSGLFLDHRPIRKQIQEESRGKSFLNLFSYTSAASVHAAIGGARSTLSLDLSKTYLQWAERNFRLNQLDADLIDGRGDSPYQKRSAHQLLRADCLEWLREIAAAGNGPKFDLIFCDPPSFSNSKRMSDVLDITRDHVEIIQLASQLLAPNGKLYFSTNKRKFKLATGISERLKVSNITRQTLDEDFKRPPPAHQCWKFEKA